jgi:hypothetical protein
MITGTIAIARGAAGLRTIVNLPSWNDVAWSRLRVRTAMKLRLRDATTVDNQWVHSAASADADAALSCREARCASSNRSEISRSFEGSQKSDAGCRSVGNRFDVFIQAAHTGAPTTSGKREGTTHLLFEPTTFIERLATLVPRPHKNLIVYSGVLAPNAKLRSRAVAYGSPAPEQANEQALGPRTANCWRGERRRHACRLATSSQVAAPELHMGRADELHVRHRVLACQHCGGRLRLLAAVMNPKAVRAILANLGLPTEAPELRTARAPPCRSPCHDNARFEMD